MRSSFSHHALSPEPLCMSRSVHPEPSRGCFRVCVCMHVCWSLQVLLVMCFSVSRRLCAASLKENSLEWTSQTYKGCQDPEHTLQQEPSLLILKWEATLVSSQFRPTTTHKSIPELSASVGPAGRSQWRHWNGERKPCSYFSSPPICCDQRAPLLCDRWRPYPVTDADVPVTNCTEHVSLVLDRTEPLICLFI